MAHPAAIITPARMDTLSFRRADGSRHEVAYDGYSIPRRPGLPFTTTTITTNTSTSTTINTSTVPRYTFTYSPTSRLGPEFSDFDYATAFGTMRGLGMNAGFGPGTSTSTGMGMGYGSGYGSTFGSSYNGGYNMRFTQRHRLEYPRSAVRQFRRDNDEPAEPMMFIRETRQSMCDDRVDRSQCSECKNDVYSGQAQIDESTVSPQRVFRDLVMSDVGEPLRPAVRDALFEAFSSQSSTNEQKPERTFHHFPLLPIEIRRMIWEAALPSRVLLRDDLCQVTYRTIRKAFRPSNHAYTIEELWQSDLFYVCAEARMVVATHVRGPGHTLSVDVPGTVAPMDPLMMNVTTRTKLRSGLDMLYYPWHGSKRATDRGGGGPIRQGPPYMALPDPAAIQRHQVQNEQQPQEQQKQQHTCAQMRPHSPLSRTVATDVFLGSPQPIRTLHRGYSGMGVYYMPGLYDEQDHIATQDDSLARREADKGPEVCLACHPFAKPTATTATARRQSQRQKKMIPAIAPFPINDIPYGHWASQLRILRVPVTSVALDAAWIDKQHPDTLAWAVGVDLSDPIKCDPRGIFAQPKPVAPKCLRFVLADIMIPVHISLDGCASPEQRALLQRHVFAHPKPTAGYRMQRARSAAVEATTDTPGSPDRDDRDMLINLNGKDYSVLVDLYDDRRIDELFSLVTATESVTKNGREVINKSALHRCIRCTRRAWETRSWSANFGARVGSHLQKICRPTLLFTVVLAFDKVAL